MSELQERYSRYNGSLSVIQAEMAFIGAVLLHPEKMMDVKIGANHFTDHHHRDIFEAIQDLESQGKMIDVITVDDRLREKLPDDDFNWLPYLGKCANDVYSETGFHTSQIVMLEKHHKREIKKIAETLFEDNDSDAAIQSLMNLDKVERKFTHATAEAALHAIEAAQEYAKHDGIPGLRTGLKLLDEAIGGLQSPDLYVVGARPAMGKTAMIINWMLNHDEPCAFFSTEQPHEQVGLRMISMTSGVSARKIRTAKFDESENNRMAYAVTKLAGKKIFIHDQGYLTIGDLMREARRLKYNHGIKAIYVDYIQRVRAKAENRRLEVAEVVTSLKSLAKELGVPVIALAQVSRNVDKLKEPKPGMSDLLESGVIEQEADVVMTLYREEEYFDNSQFKGTIEIIICKNRHGPTGAFRFSWLPETMQVKNLATEGNY
jgi:replicative DNA helicase